jgi:MFS family permease
MRAMTGPAPVDATIHSPQKGGDMRQGPLAGRYPAAAAMVIFALVPYLVLSAALGAITPIIAGQLHMSLQAMNLTSGMANAGYAVGTVLAVQFAQHLRQRRMLLAYGALLVIGSLLAAAAADPAMFIAGHVLQGLCTSLLLIAAVPPLVTGYSVEKMRITVVIMNMCVFGAVALGPVLGGVQASAHAWRPLFWIIAGISVIALVLSVLTFEDDPPANPSAPRDWMALALATTGPVAAFFGASELLTHRFLAATTFLPLIGGLALIVALFVHQYRTPRPLLCVRSLASTIPVAGIVIAMCAAAASGSAIALTENLLAPRFAPLHLGLLYLPEFGGAVITAVGFGIVFRTRLLHYYAMTGLLFLAAGVAIMAVVAPPTAALTAVGSGLVGIGVGASVTPALFLVGFSLRSNNLQRVFALIELLRATAAFMIAPVLLHFALTIGSNPSAGTSTALWICFGVSVGGAVLGASFYVLGGVRPQAPSLERWRGGQEPGWESPPLLARIRRGPSERPLEEPERPADEPLASALPDRAPSTAGAQATGARMEP